MSLADTSSHSGLYLRALDIVFSKTKVFKFDEFRRIHYFFRHRAFGDLRSDPRAQVYLDSVLCSFGGILYLHILH